MANGTNLIPRETRAERFTHRYLQPPYPQSLIWIKGQLLKLALALRKERSLTCIKANAACARSLNASELQAGSTKT
jgi:hypothetical protein